MNQIQPMTQGVHHIGLTVSRLEESAQFFTQVLGWKEVKRNPDYPAIFVSDGHKMVTLWAAQTDAPDAFNKSENVGLHHLALWVKDLDTLENIHQRLQIFGVHIEFAPEALGNGTAQHLFCFEPSGIRIEFFCEG